MVLYNTKCICFHEDNLRRPCERLARCLGISFEVHDDSACWYRSSCIPTASSKCPALNKFELNVSSDIFWLSLVTPMPIDGHDQENQIGKRNTTSCNKLHSWNSALKKCCESGKDASIKVSNANDVKRYEHIGDVMQACAMVKTKMKWGHTIITTTWTCSKNYTVW